MWGPVWPPWLVCRLGFANHRAAILACGVVACVLVSLLAVRGVPYPRYHVTCEQGYRRTDPHWSPTGTVFPGGTPFHRALFGRIRSFSAGVDWAIQLALVGGGVLTLAARLTENPVGSTATLLGDSVLTGCREDSSHGCADRYLGPCGLSERQSCFLACTLYLPGNKALLGLPECLLRMST